MVVEDNFVYVVSTNGAQTCESPHILKWLTPMLLRHTNILIPFAGKTRFNATQFPSQRFTYIDVADNLPEPYLHGYAEDIIPTLPLNHYDCVVFDPPFSYFQTISTYGNQRVSDVAHIKDILLPHLNPAQPVETVTFGFNSVGFGAKRGFKKTGLLVQCNGGNRNDYLLVMEYRAPTVPVFDFF